VKKSGETQDDVSTQNAREESKSSKQPETNLSGDENQALPQSISRSQSTNEPIFGQTFLTKLMKTDFKDSE
jgi:hypothetical protein